MQAVKRWLEQHEGWLLVFDNATEPEVVRPYLPQGQSGHVVITSRYWDWGAVASGLGVEVFDRDTESVPFLLRRTSQTDEAAARVLADVLGNLPLALAQAAAYIAGTGRTLAGYTELFEKRRADLWQKEKPPDTYPAPVAVTWSLAMEEMAKESAEAAELLYLLAYLAPEPVSQEWLLEGANHLSGGSLPQSKNPFISFYQRFRAFFVGRRRATLLGNMVTDPVVWDQGMAAFRRYALVEVTEAGLVVHRLVQAVTRDRLAAAERLAWAAAAVQVMAAAYPRETYSPRDIGIWDRCAELLSHALVAAEHAGGLAVALEATGELLSRVESYLDSQGRYEEAIPLSERALAIGEQTLRSDHPTVATRLNNLAELYRDQGRLEEAEPLYLRTVEIDEKVYGPDHPEVATDLNNLAVLYRDQGRLEEAEPLAKRALSISEEALGTDHPTIATRMNVLGYIYRAQGRLEEAEPLYERALAISEQRLGSDHPTVATRLNNLARLYQDQSRYAEAEPLYLRCLAIADAALGPDHPNTQTYRQHYERFRQARDAAR